MEQSAYRLWPRGVASGRGPCAHSTAAWTREKTAPFELGQGEDACLLSTASPGSPWDVRPLGEALARARLARAAAPGCPGTAPPREAMLARRHARLGGRRGRRAARARRPAARLRGRALDGRAAGAAARGAPPRAGGGARAVGARRCASAARRCTRSRGCGGYPAAGVGPALGGEERHGHRRTRARWPRRPSSAPSPPRGCRTCGRCRTRRCAALPRVRCPRWWRWPRRTTWWTPAGAASLVRRLEKPTRCATSASRQRAHPPARLGPRAGLRGGHRILRAHAGPAAVR